MKTYNGHRSWNAWNVSLWIGNDEPLYRFAMECLKSAREWYEGKQWSSHNVVLRGATRRFMRLMGDEKTPDGATYNALSVKLALEGYMED